MATNKKHLWTIDEIYDRLESLYWSLCKDQENAPKETTVNYQHFWYFFGKAIALEQVMGLMKLVKDDNEHGGH